MLDGISLSEIIATTEHASLVETPANMLIVDRHDNMIANFFDWGRTLYVHRLLPDTVLAALVGRPLSDCIDLTGLVTRPHTIIRSASGPGAGQGDTITLALGGSLEPVRSPAPHHA